MSFRVGAAAAALAVSVALGSTWAQKAWAQAQIPNKIYVMKVSNSTINDAPHQYAKDFAAAVERDFRRSHQVPGLPRKPIGLDPSTDRRGAVWRDPGHGDAA